MRSFLVALTLAVAGCAAGAEAPEPGPTATLCATPFCLDLPGDWDGEVGEDFITIAHGTEEEAHGSVGFLNMEAVVSHVGDTWSGSPEDAARSFWMLLDELGSASLDEVVTLADGSVRSVGSLDGGRMWHRLVPIEAERAVAVEVRGPNSSWSIHADIILDGLVATEGP